MAFRGRIPLALVALLTLGGSANAAPAPRVSIASLADLSVPDRPYD